MTPIRVVCNNTLNLALSNTRRCWTTRHVGDINSKLEEARSTLALANSYMENLTVVGDKLANLTFDMSKVEEFVDLPFKVEDDASDRVKNNSQEMKDGFMYCYFAPDIAKFQGTAWGLVNAASDFAGHARPRRVTSKTNENRWANTMNGNIIVDTTFLHMMKLLNKEV